MILSLPMVRWWILSLSGICQSSKSNTGLGDGDNRGSPEEFRPSFRSAIVFVTLLSTVGNHLSTALRRNLASGLSHGQSGDSHIVFGVFG